MGIFHRRNKVANLGGAVKRTWKYRYHHYLKDKTRIWRFEQRPFVRKLVVYHFVFCFNFLSFQVVKEPMSSYISYGSAKRDKSNRVPKSIVTTCPVTSCIWQLTPISDLKFRKNKYLDIKVKACYKTCMVLPTNMSWLLITSPKFKAKCLYIVINIFSNFTKVS